MNFLKNYNLKISYLFTALIFFSMGVNPSYIENDTSNLNFLINSIRFFLPTVFLIGYYLVYKKKLFFNFLKYNYLISLLFLIFVLIFFFSILFDFSSTQNLYFLTYLNIFLFIGLLSIKGESREAINNLILFICLGLSLSIILFLVEIFNFSINLYELHNLRVFSFDARFLDQSLPRSTGVAKFILLSILVLLTLPKKKNSFKNLVFLIIFCSFLFLIKSRTNILFFFIFIIFYLFYFKLKIKTKIKILFATFIIPIIIYFLTPDYVINPRELNDETKDYVINPRELNDETKILTLESNKILIFENFKKKTNKLLIKSDNKELKKIENVSTGRIFLWNQFIYDLKNNNLNFLIGKGILADKKIYSQSISNGFFYSFLSGGLIVFLIYISFNLIIIFNVLKYLSKRRIIEQNLLLYAILAYLIFRSILENGYIIYLSDLYLVLISIFLLKPETLKK